MARGKRGSCPFLGPEHLLGLIAVAFLVTMIKYLPKMMQGRKGLLRKLLWGAVVHCSNRSWGWVSELTHHVIPDFKKQQVECRTGSKPQGLYPPLGDPLSLTAEPPKDSATFPPAGNQMLKHMVGGGGGNFTFKPQEGGRKKREWMVTWVTENCDDIKCYSVVDLWIIKIIHIVGHTHTHIYCCYLKNKYIHLSGLSPTPSVSPLATRLM